MFRWKAYYIDSDFIYIPFKNYFASQMYVAFHRVYFNFLSVLDSIELCLILALINMKICTLIRSSYYRFSAFILFQLLILE